MTLRAAATHALALTLFSLPAVVCSCDGRSTPSDDGGTSFDAPVYTDGAADAATDAAACGPVDVSSYQPAPLTPPNPAHQNKCTGQQVSDYAQCQGAKNTSLCQQFADGQPGQTCRQCIETQSTDPRWGVLVFDGSKGTYNTEGCVDDALSQLAEEKASGGTGSCGDLLFASYGCQGAACGACKASAFDTCVSSAVDGVCKSYDALVESATGPCADLFGDAAPSAVRSCFPDASIADPKLQQVDWLERIVGFMCGS